MEKIRTVLERAFILSLIIAGVVALAIACVALVSVRALLEVVP